MRQSMTEFNYRLAEEKDIPRIKEMVRDFYEFSNYSEIQSWDPNHVETLIKWYIDHSPDMTFIVVMEKDMYVSGFISGIKTPSLSSADLIALEQIWWVDEEFRKTWDSLRLLALFEEWAKRSGCRTVCMSSIEGVSRVDRIYERAGYRLTEKTYSKRI